MTTMETSAQAKERLTTLITKARQEKTKDALRACLTKPTRDKWFAAERAAWNDVPLSTNDCLWLRARAMEMPA